MSHRRPYPLARSPRSDRPSSVLKAIFVLALSSIALSAATPAHAAPTGPAAKSAPTVKGPFVYPAVKPLVFTGSLRSLPIAQPEPARVFPIGFPRPLEPLPPGGGTIGPAAPPAVDDRSLAGVDSPIDFSDVYPDIDGAFDLCCPSDPNGDVGPNHYIQTVNSSFQVFNKQGGTMAGPSRISTIWTGAGDTTSDCATNDSGDPIVKYDRAANRWLISQFALPNGLFNAPSSECIAISRTGDPVNGGWFIYTFRIPGDRIDYPKFGVWSDAYYMSSQQGYSGGSLDAWAFDRANMLNGTFVTPVRFTIGGPALILLPADLDGVAAPPFGAPAPFARAIDGDLWGGSDRVEVYDFHVDWGTPGNSTFTPNVTLPTSFDGNLCNGQDLDNDCVPQPGTGTLLETLSNWSMQPLQYRNFGSHDTLVFNHTVDSNGSDHAGVRWYELRRNTPGSGAWTMRQQATYASDAVHSWMGSIAMNGAGDMALGYSVSNGTSVYPGIRYAGRLSSDPLNTMPQGEFTIVDGGSSSVATRWGDYSAMAVDPVDDCTFWYTDEYEPATGRGTRIGAFKFPSCVKRISIDDVSHNEGNSGTTAYTFTVSLSGPTGTVVTVDYATSDGSATTADGDYGAASGTVTFQSGETTKTVTVLVNGDNKFEPNENFLVNLSNALGADIADDTGVGTIVNDDPQPTISINDVSEYEGHFGQTPFTYTVSLSNPSYLPITVDYATADGTATIANNDYQSRAGTVVFLPEDTSENVTVPVIGDIVVEPDETYFVNLSNPTNATIADAQGLGTILNDDLSPDVACTITGTNGDDVLVGTPGNDVICGLAGDDRISGGGGHDVLLGNSGGDAMFGEAGNDLLIGGSGKDDDVLDGGAGNDNLQGEEGNDTLIGGTGSNALFGANGGDSLTGGTGNDLISGGNGNDTQVGGAGSDSLLGDAGGDSLNAQDGVSGNDTADGGKGTDTCVSDPGDTVINCP
jgi:Ca2+-binding RTX toxin-like protein